MKEFNLNGEKYDGLFLLPIDIENKKIHYQLTEYVEIFLKSLRENYGIPAYDKGSYDGKQGFDMNGNRIELFLPDGAVSKRFLTLIVPINYLSLERICDLNQKANGVFQEDSYSGDYYLKERGAIESLISGIEFPFFGEYMFPTILKKAAHMMYLIARYQSFSNGNKRTALLSTIDFLHINYLKFDFKDNLQEKLYDFCLGIAKNEKSEKDTEDFLHQHVVMNFEIIDDVVSKNVFFKKVDNYTNM